MDGSPTRRDWEELPPDPDLAVDLGYDMYDLEAYETDDDHVLVIPPDEEMLREDAFMVVRKRDMCSPSE